MRRFHGIELHEQPWYPAALRRTFQDGLGYVITHLGMYHNMAEPFAQLIERVGAESVLDLCSGSSEPVVDLLQRAAQSQPQSTPPKVLLSDLFPNIPHFERLKSKHGDRIDYCADPVNAMGVPQDKQLPRVRTVFSALHHFRPNQVHNILANAAQDADAIAVFEGTGRTWANMFATCAIPVTAAVVTAFLLRPWSWKNVFWSLVVPVIPLTALVDGLVSNLRTYTEAELQAMVDQIDAPDFAWEVGSVPIPHTRLRATYLFGWRRSLAASRKERKAS